MVTSDDNDCQQHVNDFFSVLKEKLKSHRNMKRYMDRFLSTDFNVFTCIKPDEKRLSNVIANLLNPTGSHGQQSVFLDAFLRRIGKADLCEQQPRQVTTEYRIEHPEGSIDVLVDFGAFVIAIENKPWAKEGYEQLDKYSNYLNKEYNDQFCLIYLTLSRDEPGSIPRDKRGRLMEEGKLLCISYRRDILEWLRECCQLCESDKFRGFLRDFMNYIPTMEEEMSNSSERKMIVEHALENKKNLEIALDVYLAYTEILRLISETFYRDLQRCLERCLEKHLDMSQWEFITLFEGSSFGFAKKAWGQRYIVGMTLYNNAETLCFGVLGANKKSNSKGIEGLKEAIDMHTMKGKSSDNYWEWYCDLKPHWDPEKTLVEMKYNRDAIKERLCKHLADISKNRKAMKLIDKYVIDHPTKS